MIRISVTDSIVKMAYQSSTDRIFCAMFRLGLHAKPEDLCFIIYGMCTVLSISYTA